MISPAMLRVEIEDDGVGFALAAIADDRIGVRRSILGAAAAAEGVAAEIRTAPGEGSKVVLVWRA
jgi:nitrate/nitrite-specific signal transduction histidine kinase